MTEEQLLTTENYTWPHDEAMADNNISASALPNSIKSKIKAWKMQAGKYNSAPTEGKFAALCKMSEEIGVLIDEIPSGSQPEEVQTKAPKAKKPAEKEVAQEDAPKANQETAAVPAQSQNQPDAPNIAGLVNSQTKSVFKDQINSIISKDGRIYHSDLKDIMGVRNLSDVVDVEGMVLERHWAFYYPAK